MNDFMINAKGLAKNPLGIIALFISLIYGFASLVLGFAADSLKDNERLIFIWFLVTFPIIVLGVFVYLVVLHHKKLYSPTDFRADKSFLETIDKNQKIIAEFQESKTDNNETAKIKDSNISTSTIKQFIKPQSLEFNDFKEKYLKIENLVLYEIEKTYNTEVKRNVRIKGLKNAEFDGVITKNDEVIFIEIKYVKSISMSSSIIERIKLMAKQLEDFSSKGYLDRKITFLVYIVYETEKLDFLLKQISDLKIELENNKINILILRKHYLSLEKDNNGNQHAI
ncbi:MAG: hypothetical protein DRJ01_11830 [Bacteroidetes bacterium]|nr:MAG: hypothetical protein DRJ01_11830 [Bacteroidota bacterium]